MINTVWQWFLKLPGGLRKGLAILFVGGGMLGVGGLIVLLGYVSWSSGYIYERTGYLPPDQVNEIKSSVRERSDDEVAKIAGAVVSVAMDSARASQDSMWVAVSQGLIEPGIKELKRNSKDIRTMQTILGVNTDRVTEQTEVTAETSGNLAALSAMMNDQKEEQIDFQEGIMNLLEVYRADQLKMLKKWKIEPTKEF